MTLDRESIRHSNRLEDIIPALTGKPLQANGTGEPKYCCPFHPHDDHPSGRVNLDKQTFYCDVCLAGGDVFRFVEKLLETDFAGAQRWLTERIGDRGQVTIVATYDYRDEGSDLLYQVVRCEPKSFRQRRPDGQGGWRWNLDHTRRVLYRLPELKGKDTVYLAEGEKDVDELWRLGIPATTNAGGAGKWTEEYTQQLRAAGIQRAVVLRDNDDAGRRHGERVAASCQTAGMIVKVPDLPDLPAHGDVSDYLATHGKDELVALVKTTPVHARVPSTGTVGLTALRELLAEPDDPVDWIVTDRIPAGSASLFSGKPKTGKSTTLRSLAFAVATGKPWLGSPTRQGVVWILAFEDKRSEIRRHFRQMGATGQEPIRLFINQAPPDVVPQVCRLVKTECPSLIIIDTLQRFIQARDLNDYSEVVTKYSGS